MGRRIAAIAVAILLLAAGAAGGLFLILSADQRAQARIQDPVTVLIAKQDLAAGTSGEKIRGLVEERRLPRSVVDEGALTGLGPEYDTQVLQTSVRAGTMLLAAAFGAAGDAPVTPEGDVQVPLRRRTHLTAGSAPELRSSLLHRRHSGQGHCYPAHPRAGDAAECQFAGRILRVWVAVRRADANSLVLAMNTGTL